MSEENFLKIGLDHFSPSQLLRPTPNWLFEYVYLSKDQRRSITVGENAAYGTAVHNGIQANLVGDVDVEQAIDQALLDFDFHPADEDAEKRVEYRSRIPAAVELGCEHFKDLTDVGDEQKIHLELPDVSIPLTGYIDLVSDGNLYEMKTKAPRKGQIKKDGTRGWSKPALPKEPDYNHLCQVAVYQKATGLKPNIVYISDTDIAHFDQDNCDKLSPEYLEYCLYDLRRRALIRQNLLAVSTDPKVLAGLVEPEFNHPFYWKNQFIDEARTLWNL